MERGAKRTYMSKQINIDTKLIRIGTDYHTEVKVAAAKKRISIKELVEECIDMQLSISINSREQK
jgi:predicted HicB family RNase H-like nuclease